jgi:UDP-N-acetylmuramoyl-tripeptide--D-alanyl-D-alanine ligase
MRRVTALWTSAEIEAATGGTASAAFEVSGVTFDSREAGPGDFFVAMPGTVSDGHAFVDQAFAQGAVAALVSQAVDGPHVLVADVAEALTALAIEARRRTAATVIGVTGSVGKTSTKEALAAALARSRKGPVHRSVKSYNNHTGVPLSLARMPRETRFAVLEMGMNHAGEIAEIAGSMRPNVGVYTNIAPVHIEFFGTIEKIAAAKRELLENLAPHGTVIVNTDNEHVVNISRDFDGPKVTYGIDHEADYRARDIRERGLLGTRFTLDAEGTTRELELLLPGRHNLDNLLAAIATARAIGISWDGIGRGVSEVKPAYHRGVIVPHESGATIYDDTYNSNPYALARTLELMTQADVRGRRIAVIGDMLELGEQELQFHRDAGKGVPQSIDVVMAVAKPGAGARSNALLDGAREAGFGDDALHHFDNAQAAGEFLKTFLRDGDLVLIKGSRGVGLDQAVAMLTNSSTEGTH